jgi:hypothetical protein
LGKHGVGDSAVTELLRDGCPLSAVHSYDGIVAIDHISRVSCCFHPREPQTNQICDI